MRKGVPTTHSQQPLPEQPRSQGLQCGGHRSALRGGRRVPNGQPEQLPRPMGRLRGAAYAAPTDATLVAAAAATARTEPTADAATASAPFDATASPARRVLAPRRSGFDHCGRDRRELRPGPLRHRARGSCRGGPLGGRGRSDRRGDRGSDAPGAPSPSRRQRLCNGQCAAAATVRPGTATLRRGDDHREQRDQGVSHQFHPVRLVLVCPVGGPGV